MEKKEILKIVQQIDEVYNKYLANLSELRKLQDAIILTFTKSLEEKKIKQVKKDLGIE